MLDMLRIKILSIFASEFILDKLASFVAVLVSKVNDTIKVDKKLHSLGLKIRDKIPGESVESVFGELICSFRAGLLGKEFSPVEIKQEAEEEAGNLESDTKKE